MDANERLHWDWIGMAQPEGLVVTTAALKAAEANITWPAIELQVALRDLAGETGIVLDQRRVLTEVLGWSEDFLVSREDLPETLRIRLEGGESLVPNFALRSADEGASFAVLVGMPEKWSADLDSASNAGAFRERNRLLGIHDQVEG
jgi:hypothetical protein